MIPFIDQANGALLERWYIASKFENEDDEENYWEYALSKVSTDSVMVVFIHAHDGSELFFKYTKK